MSASPILSDELSAIAERVAALVRSPNPVEIDLLTLALRFAAKKALTMEIDNGRLHRALDEIARDLTEDDDGPEPSDAPDLTNVVVGISWGRRA